MTTTHTILIIDDEANLRDSMAEIFRGAGYAVTLAGDGQEALDLFQAGSFDLVVLDLRMPRVEGLGVLRAAHQLYPEMPVLILTGHATLDSATEALRLGARDYIYKPADPDQIIARARTLIAERESPQRRRELLAQMQALVSELHQLDRPPTAAGASAPSPAPAEDPARFLHCGPLTLDLKLRSVTRAGERVPIAGNSLDYLVTLIRHAPETVPFKTLVLESQGYQMERIDAQETSRWWIHKLRAALDTDGRQHIFSVRGIGYRLVF
ncbi:MAG: response regulator transcription factor [Anaerolineae bacterium]